MIIYRKILLTCLTFMSEADVGARGVLVFLLISIACGLHFRAEPYVLQFYNLLEMRSLFVSLWSVYLGLFFVANVNEVIQAIMFIAILAVNLHFFLLWFMTTLRIAIEYFIGSFGFALRLGVLMKPLIGLISSELFLCKKERNISILY